MKLNLDKLTNNCGLIFGKLYPGSGGYIYLISCSSVFNKINYCKRILSFYNANKIKHYLKTENV